MDLRKVKKLIELVEESGINELEVTSGDESVRISMGQNAATVSVPAAGVVPEPVAATPDKPQPVAATSKEILAPMAGTFYRASNPEAAPFVEEGSEIAVGDVVCIIESMKMMHEVRSSQAGTVTHIPVANGTPINSNTVLFVLS